MRNFANRGFSLIEMMIVVALIGIAMAIGFPSIQSLINNQKMKSATFDLVTTAMQARSEAMKWGAPTGGMPSISIVRSAGGWTDGWCIVFTSGSTCNVLDDAGPGTGVMMANKAVAKVGYVASPNPIVFRHTGRLASGAAVRILVTDDDNYAPPRCVVIDSNGNPKTYLKSGGDMTNPTFKFGGSSSTETACS